jgi:hypothetical protein
MAAEQADRIDLAGQVLKRQEGEPFRLKRADVEADDPHQLSLVERNELDLRAIQNEPAVRPLKERERQKTA